MEGKDATEAEQPDVVALDQVQPQLHGAYVAQQQQAHLGVGAGAQAPPSAALWAPASADAQHSRDTLPGHTNLLSRLSLPGLASTLELEAGLAAASGVDPLSTSGGLHGLWSGSDSRGTTPSSTTSSSGGRLQPGSDQKASELALQAHNRAAGSSAPGFQQARQQQQQGDCGALSLPASPTMLQYQQAAAVGGAAAGCSGLSSPSSGSWPDADFSSGALLPGVALEGGALDGQPWQGGRPAAGVRSDGRGGSGSDSGGEGDAGMLVPSTVPLLKQEPGVPLGLQLHMPPAAQQAPQHGAGRPPPDPSVLVGSQQPSQQCRVQDADQLAAAGRNAAAAGCADGRRLVELCKQQQQHRDAQLMPPPAPPQHMARRGQGQSPAAVAAAAAAAAAADAAARSSARPPPLVIPSTSAPSTGTGGSSQPPAGQQLSYPQAHTHVVQKQQQQQQGGHQGFDRPGSGPSPSPAYPPSSTTITPSMLSMGLAESHPALAAGVTAGGPSAAAAAAAAGAGGWVPSGDGSTSSSSAAQVPRSQCRPQSLPSSPAIAPAAAAGGTAAGEYSSSAGILASAAAAAAGGGVGGSGAGTSGLSAAATAVLGSCGRVYIKVQCGSQFGWLDVRDSLVIVDVGTKRERKLTFAKFESLGGRGATRKWRTSILALPDGPGDAVVPRTMPLGELLRRLNTDTQRIGQPGFGQEPLQQQQGGQAGSTPCGNGSQGAAAAPGVTPSPEPRASAASTPAAGLFSPGQRRPREESEGPSDQAGFRPCSADPCSRADRGTSQDGEGGVEGYGLTKRPRSSQDGVVVAMSQQHTGSQQSLSQQQQQPAAAAVPWLTSPPAAAVGLSISAGGPLPQQGFGWHLGSHAAVGTRAGTNAAGASAAATGTLPPLQLSQQQQHQQQQRVDVPAVLKQQQQQGFGQGCSSQGDGRTAIHQQQHQQQGSMAYDQEMPTVMSLTPPDQVVAAMQQPPVPPSGPSSSAGAPYGQQRRKSAGGGSSGGSGGGGGMATPPSSQSPAVGAAAAAASPIVVTSAHGGTVGEAGRGRAGSEDGRQQQQQQPQVSSSGRPIRQQSRRAVSAAAAAAARLDSYDKDSGPVSYAGGLRFLQVWCDQLPGNLDLHRMMVIPQAGEREGQPMSLSQFEILGGRGSARKWRRSVSVQDDGQMISLGDWLEKYAETPGEGPVAPTYSRYSAGSSKQRSSTASPGVAGAAAAAAAVAAAAAAAAQLPGSVSWQHMQRLGEQQQQQQRDQGPARGAGGGGSQGRLMQPAGQPTPHAMQGASYGLLGPQVYSQQQPPQQPVPHGREKQSSPVLDDFSGPASQAAAAAMRDMHAGARLQHGHHLHHHQQGAGGGSAGRMGWGLMQAVGPQFAAQGMHMGSTYGQGATLPHPAPAAAAAAGTALGPAQQQQQQLLPPHAPAPAAGGGVVGGLAYGGGDVVLSSDFWQDIMADLAHDPVVDPHLLHPAQVDVDMADSSRSPLNLNQQLLMLGSPPPGSTAAAAAAGAAAIMGGYSSQVTGPHAGPTGMAPMHLQQHQQHELFPGSSVFLKQEQQDG